MRASTSERRRIRPTPALLAGALVLAGCVAALRVDSDGRRFDHSHHVKRGLDCLDCHADAKTKARAGMPAGEACRDCHGEADELSVATSVSAYASLSGDARHARPKTFADVTFDHAKHAEKHVACADCHKGASTEPRPDPAGPLRMKDCTGCHKERGGPEDCRACHESWARDVKPATHRGDWERGHGLAARLNRENVTVAAVERCELCHARSACDSCHLRDAPRNHTEAWRTATHGLTAAIDRSRCTACHAADSCNRCHQVQPPHTHNAGSWSSPRNGHCVSCHAPLSSSACFTCHKGTPRHAAAPARPASHVRVGDCRPCHAPGSRLPHADNGSDCNACHR